MLAAGLTTAATRPETILVCEVCLVKLTQTSVVYPASSLARCGDVRGSFSTMPTCWSSCCCAAVFDQINKQGQLLDDVSLP